MTKKVLITGGLGYIGSHTIVKLYENGYEPIIIDDLSNSDISVLDRIEKIVGVKPDFHKLSINNNNIANIAQIILKNKVTHIIHFAGYKSVKESVENPIKYFDNNIGSTIAILHLAWQLNTKLVFSSSATVYGEADYFPVSEQTERKRPINPYGESKYICEDIIESMCKFKNVSAVSLRYFNPIGAHPSGKIFENPKNTPENLMPYIQRVIFGEYEKLTIFGNDYDTIDGTCVRDYIDVNDLAQAHINALDACKGGYKVYNIGSGEGYSVMEIINEFKKQGVNIPYVVGERRSGDVPKIYADITKAKKEMNWSPKIPLQETVKTIINLKF
jgi:UDP-glucose 4-epimerase